MIEKLKKLPPMWAMFVFVTVFAFGAFSIGCGDSYTDDQSDDSTADGGDGHDDEDGEDGHDDENGGDGHDDEDDGHADVGETDVSADSFGDVAAVWAEVMTLKAELDDVISSGNLADVHTAAAAVRDHVQLLADMSDDLPADEQANLAIGISSVASLWVELDNAGDSGNQEETEAANARLQTVLDAIEAIYPEGTLK